MTSFFIINKKYIFILFIVVIFILFIIFFFSLFFYNHTKSIESNSSIIRLEVTLNKCFAGIRKDDINKLLEYEKENNNNAINEYVSTGKAYSINNGTQAIVFEISDDLYHVVFRRCDLSCKSAWIHKNMVKQELTRTN